jgi:hypothetical protein
MSLAAVWLPADEHADAARPAANAMAGTLHRNIREPITASGLISAPLRLKMPLAGYSKVAARPIADKSRCAADGPPRVDRLRRPL